MSCQECKEHRLTHPVRKFQPAPLPVYCLALFSLICSATGAASAQTPQSTQVATAKPPDEADQLQQQLATAAGEPTSISAAASTNGQGPAGIVPITRGPNASLMTTSQHDSSDGWSEILTPNIAYRFDRHFSANLGLPVYAYIDVNSVTIERNKKGVATGAVGSLQPRKFLLGDTDLAAEFEAHPHFLDYNLTATLGMPTGDDAKGLGAGQFTYNFDNHFERQVFDWLTPELELGFGDSANLNNTLVRKSYTVVGDSAHFQVGVGISMPFDIVFTTDAYEDLPIGLQSVTSTTSNGKKGKQLQIVTSTTEESGIGEDNGFLNTLDIPLNRHITLSGFYNRSLRDKIDTAGFSLTFLLRGLPKDLTVEK
jgi:hypothetical protein